MILTVGYTRVRKVARFQPVLFALEYSKTLHRRRLSRRSGVSPRLCLALEFKMVRRKSAMNYNSVDRENALIQRQSLVIIFR